MFQLKPFAEDASLALDGLTVESSADRVSIYGSLQIPRDRSGLDAAKQIKAIIDATVTELEITRDLPDRLGAADIDTDPNPMA
jgi:hypothetical protein